MGTIKEPQPVKLVIPMIAGEEVLFDEAVQALVERFGPVDYRSATLPFTHTTYYEREFGPNLLRQFASFERLIDPGELARIKRLTNDLEIAWADASGRRRINLDPGYLTQAKFVLATTKNQAHRIYIGEGIYAEVTLIYRHGAFEPLPWTYPDYRTPEYRAILATIRALYDQQIKSAAR
ncbi:MAG: DUF4416 family protein [Chloroflexi bacterium]|nr:DUF4416 family protein [Chloroflexota bacterium]